MAFVGVQFDDTVDGSLALVHRKWLTPRKHEAFWPPFKQQDLYYRSLKRGDDPVEDQWTVYPIQRCFFECDDFDKAKAKIKTAEFTSDLATDDDGVSKKRKRAPVRRLYDSHDDSDDESEVELSKKKSNLPRPPIVKKPSQLSHFVESQSPSSTISCAESLSAASQCSTPSRISLSSSGAPAVHSSASLNPPAALFENVCNEDRGFQAKFISHLSTVIEQNKEMLAMLKDFKKQSNALNYVQKLETEPNLPVKLPLESFEDLDLLEDHLGDKGNEQLLCAYLATLDRNNLISSTNSALRYCLSYKLAKEISFLGTRNNKKPFNNYRLKKVIVAAVKRAIPSAIERNIEDGIKDWLKRSPKNYNLELHKRQKHQDRQWNINPQ